MSEWRRNYVDYFPDSGRHCIGAIREGGADNSMWILWVKMLVAETGDEMLSEEGVKTGEEVLDGLVGGRRFDRRFFFFCHKL